MPRKEDDLMKFLRIGTHGSERPTHAVLPLLQAQGAIEEGHEAEVLLVGDAVVLLKDAVAKATIPVGWPPVADVLNQLIAHKVPIGV
jgi:predicted peroxiredoxin